MAKATKQIPENPPIILELTGDEATWLKAHLQNMAVPLMHGEEEEGYRKPIFRALKSVGVI